MNRYRVTFRRGIGGEPPHIAQLDLPAASSEAAAAGLAMYLVAGTPWEFIRVENLGPPPGLGTDGGADQPGGG